MKHVPTSSRSLCFPPARMHFCEFAARFKVACSLEGSTWPKKMGLNWFMPEFANCKVGSLLGTTGELGTKVWPCFSTKKSRKALRTLSLGQFDIVNQGNSKVETEKR